jgi:hypothetical protein
MNVRADIGGTNLLIDILTNFHVRRSKIIMISPDLNDGLENGLNHRMESTGKHINPRSEGNLYVVKMARSRSLNRPESTSFHRVSGFKR